VTAPRSAWSRFVSFYKGLALFMLNTLVLLIFVWTAGWIWMSSTYDRVGRRIERYTWKALDRAYPGWSREDVEQLLRETWSRPVVFDAFTHFRERPIEGRFVRVSTDGYRHVKEQGPWPPAAAFSNVLVFGGSTTFGYGVADHETIPSALQEALSARTARPTRVYNLGCAFYYSSQERILFEKLLLAGIVPDVAVFVDGFNDFSQSEDEPNYSDQLRDFMGQRGERLRPNPYWYHVLSPGRLAEVFSPPRVYDGPGKPASAESMIARYLHNKKMIEGVASRYDVRVLFVIQPVSAYGYDAGRHAFGDQFRPSKALAAAYQRMSERLKAAPASPELLWAADIQGAVSDPLYVDGAHYAPNLCRATAAFIAEALIGSH
jgi:hypothetical protein